MANVTKAHIKPKSFLVFDGWKASRAASERLGYRYAPPVSHSLAWRDISTGFHCNDAESENRRLKTWLRARYTKLRLTVAGSDDADVPDPGFALDLYEYTYYANVGNSVGDVCGALQRAAGAHGANVFVA